MTLLIQPDGAFFKVVTSGPAGQNVVGPRLWQWGFAKCKPKKENHLKGDAEPQEFNIAELPTCPATGLTHERAVPCWKIEEMLKAEADGIAEEVAALREPG